jgi:hypothetical protein
VTTPGRGEPAGGGGDAAPHRRRPRGAITRRRTRASPPAPCSRRTRSPGATVEEGSTVQLTGQRGCPAGDRRRPSSASTWTSDGPAPGARLTPTSAGSRTTTRPRAGPTQDPDADDEVPAGSTVVLEVSSGPADVAVPDVVGERSDDAGVTLGRAGSRWRSRRRRATASRGPDHPHGPGRGTPLAPARPSRPSSRRVGGGHGPRRGRRGRGDGDRDPPGSGFAVGRVVVAVTDPTRRASSWTRIPGRRLRRRREHRDDLGRRRARPTTTSTTTTTADHGGRGRGRARRGDEGGGGGGD